MMTLYIVFDSLKKRKITLDTILHVSKKAAEQAPTKLGLRAGETITVRTAILGLVTKSANDAAMVVAENLGGSEEGFAYYMNKQARALGMNRSVFRNPHGLPNLEQVTTARDIAKLSRALFRDFPEEYKYFSTASFTHRGTAHRNHNHLLGKVWGVDGIKTGLTNASGFNLAASAVRPDGNNRQRRLITVVLGGPNRHWRDRRVEELLEVHFAKLGAETKNPQLKYTALKKSLIEKSQAPELSVTDLIYETSEDEMDSHDNGSSQIKDNPLNQIIHEVHMESSNPVLPSKRVKQVPISSSSKEVALTHPAMWVTPIPKSHNISTKKKGKSTKAICRPSTRAKLISVKAKKIGPSNVKGTIKPVTLRSKKSITLKGNVRKRL